MLNFEIKKLPDEELKKIINNATAELNIRATKRKIAAWDTMVKAIKDYISQFGPITLVTMEDEYSIDGDYYRKNISR